MAKGFSSSNVSTRTATGLLLLGGGAALLCYGATRRSIAGKLLVVASVPLLLWEAIQRRPVWQVDPDDETRRALGGKRGVHVREAIRLELPIAALYAFWRRLENLPRFMQHVKSVQQDGGRSHWVATGPAGLQVEWDAELINDEPNKLIAWRSLPGSDVATAGSVNFDRVPDGSATQLTVNLQYTAPGGKAGSVIAAMFGREPSQMIREDLRRLKQLLEAGELAQATAAAVGNGQ